MLLYALRDNLGLRGPKFGCGLLANNMNACERLMLEGRADFLFWHAHTQAPNRLSPSHFRSVKAGEDVLMPVACLSLVGEVSLRRNLPHDLPKAHECRGLI
jgi:hypothetical protein